MTPTSLHERIAAADPAADAPGPDADERRRQIEAIVAEPLEAPRRSRRRPLLVAAAALAAALAAILVLAPRDDERALPGAVQAFAAKVASGKGILHYVSELDARQRSGPRGTEEAWIALGGDRWRVRVTLPGYTDDYLEWAQSRNGFWRWDARSKRVIRSPTTTRKDSGPVSLGLASAVANLHGSLRGKLLRVTGETTVDGKPAYVVLASVPAGVKPPRLYVARDGGALLRYEFNRALRYDIRTWEILADTPENRALTRMPKHPGELGG